MTRNFARRDWLIGLLIILLAFSYRMVIIWNRAHAPNAISAFDPLPKGTDQATYYSAIAGYRAGTFPPDRYFYQPGMSWFMIASSAICRTDNLGVLRIFTAALASINCGLFMAAVWLAFGKHKTSILAGVLLAVYPVGAFYDTDFVITAQASILLTIALFGVLWQWRSPHNWTGAVLYGASFGALAVTRSEELCLAPVFGLWLIWQRRDRTAFVQVALAAILCIGVMLPIILHNRADGANYLITPAGTTEIYCGNNRDTDGTRRCGQASQSTSTDYIQFLEDDIRLSPRRFVELTLHKIGLFISAKEPGNNLNFNISGESVSPLLRATPINFRMLMILFLLGMYFLVRQRDPAAVLFGASWVVFMLAILLIWIEARVRTPVIILMIPVAAFGLGTLGEQIAAWWKTAQRSIKPRRVLIPAVLIAAVTLPGYLAETQLPRPVTTGKLPDSAVPVQAVYDGTLKLVGYRIETRYSPAGVIKPFNPYVVTFYWEILAPTSVDYTFSLFYEVRGERVIGFDLPIGTVSYPGRPTSHWKPGAIYVEHVGIGYHQLDGPIGISGDLMLTVYRNRDIASLVPAEGIPSAPVSLLLAQPAILWGPGRLPDTLLLHDPPILFGKVLVLKGWAYPAEAAAGQPVQITLGWQTTAVPIDRSYILAVYLFDAADQVITQADSPPHNGELLTSSLPVRYAFADEKTLVMPSEPGRYILYAAVYDTGTGERLPVPEVPADFNNLVRLGEIEVTAAVP